ncbi:MAG: hypothetical protein NTV21_05185 [Planctomycetota bacterium]|nr:hypothetical protein [Planctomycetota bacterium]
MSRIVTRTLLGWLEQCALEASSAEQTARSGALIFAQRFGCAVSLVEDRAGVITVKRQNMAVSPNRDSFHSSVGLSFAPGNQVVLRNRSNNAAWLAASNTIERSPRGRARHPRMAARASDRGRGPSAAANFSAASRRAGAP